MTCRWEGSVIHIECLSGKTKRSVWRKLDLEKLGVEKNGLLQSMLETVDPQVLSTTVNGFFKLISLLSQTPRAIIILSTPIEALLPQDIKSLTQCIDQVVLTTTRLAKSAFTSYFRRFILKCTSKLKNGQRITAGLVASKCKDQRKGKSDPLTFENRAIVDVFSEDYLKLPLDAIPFDSLDDRKIKALNHQTYALDRLVSICTQTIDKHVETVSLIKQLKSTPLPFCISPYLRDPIEQGKHLCEKAWKAVPPSESAHVVELLIDRDDIHLKPPPKWFSLCHCPYLQYKTAITRERWEVVLSDYYLPRNVVVACLILLILETGWNVSTAIDLIATDVTPNEFGGFDLVCVKPKTDQLQQSQLSVDSIDNRDSQPMNISSNHCILAVKLLLQNRSNLDAYNKIQTNALFCILNRGTFKEKWEFVKLDQPLRHLQDFLRINNLPRYTFLDLRRVAANVEYLRTDGDIFRVQAFLGHSNVETSVTYINSTLIRMLGDANMLRFMRLLEASILYASPKRHSLRSDQLSAVNNNNLMLFPASHLDDGKKACVADRWIKSIGTLHKCSW